MPICSSIFKSITKEPTSLGRGMEGCRLSRFYVGPYSARCRRHNGSLGSSSPTYQAALPPQKDFLGAGAGVLSTDSTFFEPLPRSTAVVTTLVLVAAMT